ncbi:CmpA/NrtA family ABC transporter substrate-binding protein [Mangrovicoccus sp. HB161399]|uniref:CmpA/NrtA family ABC transporter substrate-binding protein n=1 Tax=Mangrovicoccus sp. HB161399 TaxID=2720392 RepID=UPI001553A6D9|nr:CmpA/NrtA family ABC transporter substrate-binding protein [Mangrovicoccus sp. HB161399]
MSLTPVKCGFIPLVDCAPLAVAREMGFAAEEGIDLILEKQPSWSALRDALVLGLTDCAHMLSPLPVAMSLGLGGLPTKVDALMVLSVNGNVVGVSPEVAAKMRADGWTGAFADPVGTGQHLIRATGASLRVGVPFPFSMHAELLYHWLGALGLSAPGGLDVRTVPPPLMPDALARGEIDAFCVGEPWGSYAVEQGTGELILPGAAIWAFAPEKVLAARHDWVEENPETVGRLMRALARAARWLSDRDNRAMAGDLLSKSAYLGIPSMIIDRALAGRIITATRGLEAEAPNFLHFHAKAANFPWRSQAAWIAASIARRLGLDRAQAIETGKLCFRSDLYRRNLAPIGIDMPGASEKVEGALAHEEAVASARGHMILGPDRFFDGTIFDPSET